MNFEHTKGKYFCHKLIRAGACVAAFFIIHFFPVLDSSKNNMQLHAKTATGRWKFSVTMFDAGVISMNGHASSTKTKRKLVVFVSSIGSMNVVCSCYCFMNKIQVWIIKESVTVTRELSLHLVVFHVITNFRNNNICSLQKLAVSSMTCIFF